MRIPLLGTGDPHIVDYLTLAKEAFPSFDDEVQVESLAHILAWTPEVFLTRVAPRPLLMVTGSADLTHDIDEVLTAFAAAHQPKQLEILPYDERGLTIEPGLGQAMSIAIDWFDHHLRTAATITTSPPASQVRSQGLRTEFR
ncbi:alpha/beta hydrolase [Nocardia kruczakiae]|uniref:alpha/beta hydrolase n=1 Tax=Nocardia kruczakiae TaxID=261477 RepID=UPI0007A53101|nr:alpha/beta hydrolase [Nocardia kruczakiae]